MSSRPTENWKGVARDAQPFLYRTAAGAPAANGEFYLQDDDGEKAPGLTVEQREALAFEQGVRQGETQARGEYEKGLAQNRSAVSAAIQEFTGDRQRYYERVETEVVHLSLAIARKILHREAQMDPLLLTGMVHVALQELDSNARVRLHAHPAETGFWQRYFAQLQGSGPAPEVLGDAELREGEVKLDTDIGSTHISLETQLKEIEQGFFDLLEQRPRAR